MMRKKDKLDKKGKLHKKDKLELQGIQDYLSRLDRVPFSVEFGEEWGADSIRVGQGEPAFRIRVSEPIPKRDLMASTSLALGEAYMDGRIQVEGDLYAALDLIMSQKQNFALAPHARLIRPLLHTPLTAKQQQREVRSHYDLGNDFYSLWLGETMNYSCAYFQQEDDSLDQAQEQKTARILAKLQLSPGMKLLDIGCGWGDLLIRAAKEYGVTGVGITLSREQAKECQSRIQKENLQQQLKVLVMDYRDLAGSGLEFDRVASVGMIEHVGREHYGLFLSAVNAILQPGGLFLLHFISSLKESAGDPWIRKYIFPGGMIPSLREIVHQCGEQSFHLLDAENLRRHYEKTLLWWHQNFLQALPAVETMFDQRFLRMWELYLLSCAASFRNGELDLHQLLLTKGVNNSLPLTRPY